ncbi:MAG: hypothetical protein ACHQ53_16945 [Polyangiales bacterium]
MKQGLALLVCCCFGCAPPATLRPIGGLPEGRNWEVGGAFAGVSPRPYVTENWHYVGQAWTTARLTSALNLSAVTAFDTMSSNVPCPPVRFRAGCCAAAVAAASQSAATQLTAAPTLSHARGWDDAGVGRPEILREQSLQHGEQRPVVEQILDHALRTSALPGSVTTYNLEVVV